MKTYKGTDKDMRCYGGYQYELGVLNKDDGAVRCGDKGFHSCEAPMDVLRYFPAKKRPRYFEAEAGGVIDRTDATDTKIASSELTLKREIDFPELVKVQIEYTRKNAARGTAGGDRSNLAGGDGSHLAGGDDSNISGGSGSNLVGGYWSTLIGGIGSTIICPNGAKAKAGADSLIVFTRRAESSYRITHYTVGIVDGQQLKPDTWYQMVDGEIREVPDHAD